MNTSYLCSGGNLNRMLAANKLSAEFNSVARADYAQIEPLDAPEFLPSGSSYGRHYGSRGCGPTVTVLPREWVAQ